MTPSSLRSRSFQNEIQCSAYFSLSASSAGHERLALAWRCGRTRNACSSSGVGSRPQTSRYTRRANSASATAAGSVTLRAARYAATKRSSGASQPVQDAAGTAGRSSASGASHGGGAGAEVGVARAPWSIHDRTIAISAARERILVLRHLRLDAAGEPMDDQAAARCCPAGSTGPLRPPSSASA